jgi:iron complex outermembrane receptor protein
MNQSTRSSSIRLLALVALIADASATQAHTSAGQTGTPSPRDTAPAEIIVTAQKRAENLQDVPLAVNVVTAQQLKIMVFRISPT